MHLKQKKYDPCLDALMGNMDINQIATYTYNYKSATVDCVGFPSNVYLYPPTLCSSHVHLGWEQELNPTSGARFNLCNFHSSVTVVNGNFHSTLSRIRGSHMT